MAISYIDTSWTGPGPGPGQEGQRRDANKYIYIYYMDLLLKCTFLNVSIYATSCIGASRISTCEFHHSNASTYFHGDII